jgi:hypothetical protein
MLMFLCGFATATALCALWEFLCGLADRATNRPFLDDGKRYLILRRMGVQE